MRCWKRSSEAPLIVMNPPKPPLRSSLIHHGLDRTPHRAFLRATGLDDDDLGKPMVGIVSQWLVNARMPLREMHQQLAVGAQHVDQSNVSG